MRDGRWYVSDMGGGYISIHGNWESAKYRGRSILFSYSIMPVPSSIRQVVDYIGKTGPLLMTLIGILSLLKQLPVLWMFVMFWGVNYGVNTILKLWIKEKRPNPMARFKNHYSYWGMPSGHAQSAGYCMAFFYYTRMTNLWYAVCGALTAITVWQRYASNAHTVKQLAVGLIVGVLVGIFSQRLFLDK